MTMAMPSYPPLSTIIPRPPLLTFKTRDEVASPPQTKVRDRRLAVNRAEAAVLTDLGAAEGRDYVLYLPLLEPDVEIRPDTIASCARPFHVSRELAR